MSPPSVFFTSAASHSCKGLPAIVKACSCAGVALAVRFGKYTHLRTRDRRVQIFVNGEFCRLTAILCA